VKRKRRTARGRRSAPAKRSTWTHVFAYTLALVVVLFFHRELGQSTAGCFGAAGGISGPPEAPDTDEALAQPPAAPAIQVKSGDSEGKDGLDPEDGILNDPVQ